MALQAVLFDLDGVIADSEGWWNDIDAAMLAEYGIEYHGEHKQHVLGVSFPLALGFYKTHYNLPDSLEHLTLRRQAHAAGFYARHIEPYPGAAGVLHTLRSRGLRLALATSSVGMLVLPFLQRHELAKGFDAVITGEEVTRGKPSPDIYLLAAARVAAAPHHCLVVEDALFGIQAGQAAGMKVAAIPDPRFLDVAQCRRAANFCLSSLNDLPSLVDQLMRPNS